jgi:pyruvate/2-oxoglutarate dehydrogenase complex dihydrolipoamide dehydrogenase (E3) component
LKDRNTVLVDEKQKITAANIIIATGSHAITYPIE